MKSKNCGLFKIIWKKLNYCFYYLKKKKRFIGEIEMLKSGDVLRLDQIDLETVKKKKNFKKINHTNTFLI